MIKNLNFFWTQNKYKLRFILPLINIKKIAIIKIMSCLKTISVIKNFVLTAPKSYQSVKDYIDLDKNTSRQIKIYDSETIIRKQPRSFCQDLNEQNLKDLFKAKLKYTANEQFVYLFSNVRFYGYYGGSLITADNKLIRELSPNVWGIDKHYIFSKFKLPSYNFLSGKTAILSTPEAKKNYYHWTIDLIPRLDLILKTGIKINDIDHFIVNHSSLKYQREFLQQLSIPLEKIVYCDNESHYLLEEAIIPNLTSSKEGISSWQIQFLNKITFNKPEFSNKDHNFDKIYISRQRSKQRKFINQNDIENLLIAEGFKTIHLEEHSVSEQRLIFSQAKYIFGIHGAGMTNLVYCQPGTYVIEVFPPNFIQFYFWYIADILNLNYYCLVGENQKDKDNNKKHLTAQNLNLNINNLQQYLQVIK